MTEAAATGGRGMPTTRAATGRLLALVIVGGLATAASFGLARAVTAPQGVIRNAACAWHGHDLVMTGIVVNRTMSAHEFVVTPGFSLAGRAVTRQGAMAVNDVGPAKARAWRWIDVGLANQAGTTITACNPSVGLPSSND